MRRFAVLLLAAACGGNNAIDWRTAGNRCANPRVGTDPVTGKPYPDQKGSVADEDNFLLSWEQDTYLWYRELPSLKQSDYPTPVDYFNALKTQAKTPSGAPEDKFHFTYTTTDWEALSQSGVSAGYGIQLAAVSRSRPRLYYVAYTEPGSPAATAGLQRGDQILTVDGADLINGTDTATLNAGLFPATVGEKHQLTVQPRGTTASTDQKTYKLTSASVTSAPVQHVQTVPNNATVGYLLFNSHIATSEKALVDAVTQLQGVKELVIDMRYNGGGLLAIASELAYMIAGPARTNGKTFEKLAFNDKYPARDPITGESLSPTPFLSTGVGFTVASGQALPHLDLPRVFILTGGGTCSASESVINSLRGVDVNVVLIGNQTCGKPYGFYPEDNCGTTYFAIQFKGVNAKGFGDYSDGFVPGTTTPGCIVADDFTHELGDPAEARLKTALAYAQTNSCPATVAARNQLQLATGQDDVTLFRPAPLENRILLK